MITSGHITHGPNGAINSYASVTDVKQENLRQSRMCGDPRKHVPLLEPG